MVRISRCIGCGAMREDERCQRCDYRRVELVDRSAHRAALDAQAAAQRTLAVCMPLVLSVAATAPPAGAWEDAFSSARATARELAVTLPSAEERELEQAEPELVWRCSVCGAVDAPQECLGICIWRTFEWVDARCYADALAAARADMRRAAECAGFVRLLALTQPRPGAWERNWTALQGRAAALIAAG